MVFRTQFDTFDLFPTNKGTPLHNDYKMKVFEDGSRDLVVVGQINTYEIIQSHKDSVDLKLTLERYARGDDSAINRRQAFFGDFTNMPTSLSELSQRILDAQDLFNSLDVEARREFDFDAGKFFASIGTPEFDAIVEKYNPVVEEPVLPNVSRETLDPIEEPVPSTVEPVISE